MTQEQKEKRQRLLEDLKEEIFVELDRRVKDAEETLSDQITEVEAKVEEYDTRTRKLKAYQKIHGGFQGFQLKFSYYKVPYAMTVVTGFMLFWYGMWTLLPTISIMNDNAFVPMTIGLFLLFISGATYKKLVG